MDYSDEAKHMNVETTSGKWCEHSLDGAPEKMQNTSPEDEWVTEDDLPFH